MNAEPLTVSVCIPVYNGLPWIESTLASVLAQTVQPFEIIVRDDCSTDGTWEYLNKHFHEDPRFRLLRNERNVQIGEQYNRLFDDARGNIILKLDSDDLIHPSFLERTLQVFNSTNSDVVSVGWEWLYTDGSTMRPRTHSGLLPGRIMHPANVVLTLNPFSLCFTVFKRSLLARAIRDGRYVLDTETCDFEFVMRLALCGSEFYYIEEVLGQYRRHHLNRSLRPNAQFDSIVADVLPYWYNDLVRICGEGTVRRHVRDLVLDHVKGSLRRRSPISLKGLRAAARLLCKK